MTAKSDLAATPAAIKPRLELPPTAVGPPNRALTAQAAGKLEAAGAKQALQHQRALQQRAAAPQRVSVLSQADSQAVPRQMHSQPMQSAPQRQRLGAGQSTTDSPQLPSSTISPRANQVKLT